VITESNIQDIGPDTKVLAISGRLSLGNTLMSVESGIRRVIAEGVRKLVVDLSDLNFIDSAGIGVLVQCNGEMEQAGGKVRIAGAKGLVVKSFQLVHLDRILALDADVAESLQGFE
jgi:anti-sigma B factor antagonist